MVLIKDGKLVAAKVDLQNTKTFIRVIFHMNPRGKLTLLNNHEDHPLDWRRPPHSQGELLL